MLGYPLQKILNAIENRHGPDAVAETLREAGIPSSRVYRLNVLYPDSEAQRLAAAALGRVTIDEVAEVFVSDALVRFPTWFKMCTSSRQLLELQPEVHNTFAHGLQHPAERSAVQDKFRLEKLDDELVVHYRSPNRLCEMYKAIARQVLKHYGESAEIDEPHCMNRGDRECELRIRWP